MNAAGDYEVRVAEKPREALGIVQGGHVNIDFEMLALIRKRHSESSPDGPPDRASHREGE